MQIIKISETGSHSQHQHDCNIAVGIDFGTTNSLIALSNKQVIQIITDNQGLELIPSVIAFHDDNFIVGNVNIINSFSSIKRLLGKKLSDIRNDAVIFSLVKDYVDLNNETLRIKFAEKLLTIPEVIAQIFLYLKKQATQKLNLEVKKAVITVPAHFNDAARGEVMLAAKFAGFEVLRLIAEPTAAAYAYGLNKESIGHYLVYDLGGGTFDVSILNIQTGVLQVIATGGDNILGGDDIDYLVMKYFCDKYKLLRSSKLMRLAKEAKETLSRQNKFSTIYEKAIILELDLEHFEQLILPLIKRTIAITKDTLEHAGHPNISSIVLVGGSTRIPLISKSLTQTFNTVIFSNINPDTAVVCGAALQAENLISTNVNSLLIDVVPLSLGIELNGGISEKIILRNSPIPISVTKEFTTYIDNQTSMKMHIVQGEREMVDDCRSLAKFELKLPLMRAGGVRIEVTFSIDADGILSVSALEKNSGISHAVEVKPSYGLNESEIAEVLNNAYQNATNDHNKKLLQEIIMHTKYLIYNVENAIRENTNILIKREIEKINTAINIMKKAIKSNDHDYIIECNKNFKIIIDNFLYHRLNSTFHNLLRGKHIDKIYHIK